MKHFILSIFIILSLISCTQKPANSKKIKTLIDNFASQELFNGAVVVANNDSIFFKSSYGYSNIETKESISTSTLFPIASLTKQFTATAILILQESGNLSIDDRIENYIPVPDYMETVTIRNLLNHTSGIPDYWSNDVENNDDLIINFLSGQDSLLFKPNTNFSYSNSGYFLLGKIIEAVSDTTYSVFMHEKIFKPIGMNSTFVYDGEDYDIAAGYNLKWEENEYFATTADGGIISTIDDLQIWNKSITNNTLITQKTQNLMFQPTTLEDGTIINTGLGWEVGLERISLFDHLTGKYKGVVSHTGGLSSFGAYNQYDTQSGLYIILLSNQLRPELMDLVYGINKQIY